MPLARPSRSDFGSRDEGGHYDYRDALREWQAGQNRPPPSVPAPPPVMQPPALSPEDRAAVLGPWNPEDRIMNFSGLPPQVTGRPTEGPPPQMQPPVMQPPANPYRTVLNLDPRPIGQSRPVRGDYGEEEGRLYQQEMREWMASQNQPQPSDDPDALRAWQARQEADQAANTATDQYEADIALFKDSQATELEQGIASLPGISDLSQVPAVSGGVNSIPYKPSYTHEIAAERPKRPRRSDYDSDDESAKWDYRSDLRDWEEEWGTPPPDTQPQPPPIEGGPYIPPPDPGEPYDPPPINYYTGQPVINPYTPYSTASGATPLTRKMTPGQFGQTPGFAMGDIAPIQGSQVADFNDVLNQGISMLPMNGQGDTLTTQVFQSGFRPHRRK